ncbi:transcription factor [Kwoniella heveanensis CBS 569]|nr:transcription factor [Kwoniella heveanensis CBS 569]
MGKKTVAAGGDDGPNTIFKATYSPVYEMLCRDVAVMRRRSDAYLNATQILKVAGFDKPQRTRVLEREVQKGEHEKVQGGYGKYQGTWIPIERGLALAKQYGVEDLLRPIIDYVPTSVSPPPAPKHAVAPPTKSRKDKESKATKEHGTPSKTGPTSAAALQAQAQLAASRNKRTPKQESTPDIDTSLRSAEADESLSVTPEGAEAEDSSSQTPSPVVSEADLPPERPNQTMDVDGMEMSMNMGGVPMGLSHSHMDTLASASRKRNAAMMMDEDQDQYAQLQRVRGNSAVHTPQGSPRHMGMGISHESPAGPEVYTDMILNYFVSDTTQIPQILVSPPHDYDPNSRIDEDGHTALHWACAMGRVRVVKLLLTAGASIFAGNNAEQTPLMRAVMFSNNYDMRKFPELYELLHRSTLNIDKQNRTVFHHIANLALAKGKTHAAKYYMETILSRLADYPQELADVINFQDEEGETALTVAARARSRRLVKALLDHGADPKIKNRDFKSAEDYILEDERFRSSPVQPNGSGGGTGVGGSSSRQASGGGAGGSGQNAAAGPSDKVVFAPQLYSSEAARLAGGQSLQDISAHMQSLARSFDSELQGKERDILQAKAMLTSIHTEVTAATKAIASLNEKAGPIEEQKRELEALQANLRSKVSQALKRGFEAWLAGEQGREARWRSGETSANGDDVRDLEETNSLPAGGQEVVQAEEERLRWEIEEKRRKRNELVDQFVKAQTEVGVMTSTNTFEGLQPNPSDSYGEIASDPPDFRIQ